MADDSIQRALRSCLCRNKEGTAGCAVQLANKQPPEWCQPLVDLVTCELKNGKAFTLKRYHPLNFGLLAPLNHDILGEEGLVDVDWMFRVAIFAYAGQAYTAYAAGKFLWNTARGAMSMADGSGSYAWEYGSMLQEANANAPRAAGYWLVPGRTLQMLFAPALAAANFALKK